MFPGWKEKCKEISFKSPFSSGSQTQSFQEAIWLGCQLNNFQCYASFWKTSSLCSKVSDSQVVMDYTKE